MTLFDDVRLSIQDAFERFHRDNPHVYDLFRRFALQVRGAGHSYYSADAILHRIRWYVDVETTDPRFKINNNYSSRYARKLMEEDPSFEGFFELRTLKG